VGKRKTERERERGGERERGRERERKIDAYGNKKRKKTSRFYFGFKHGSMTFHFMTLFLIYYWNYFL
jgi:hypothetical protein